MLNKNNNQWDIVDYLDNKKRYVTVKELSDKLSISQASVTKMTVKLEKFGLIKKKTFRARTSLAHKYTTIKKKFILT